MATFAVKHIDELERTKQAVFKLVRNGKCLFDEFAEEIEKDNNLSPELDELIANLESVANNERLPPQRYRILHLNSKLAFTPFEVKTSHLRMYLFRDDETGQIVLFGGKKGDQESDLERVDKLIKEYAVWKREESKNKRKSKP